MRFHLNKAKCQSSVIDDEFKRHYNEYDLKMNEKKNGQWVV